MSTILLTIIITLLVHSLIGTIVYIATNENDEFIAYYGIGIIGWIVSGFCYIVRLIKRWWCNHDKRSIFEDKDGNRTTIETDKVIYSIGYTPNDQFKNSKKVHFIGDCYSVGNLRTVIWRAHDICLKI